MIKIKFNNSDIFHEVEFSRTEHTATLKGITEENTSGFCTYRLSGEQLGDFSDFTTIYDKGDDYIVFSNDGSIKSTIDPIEDEKFKIQREIGSLKSELASTDYKIIKCSEYQLSNLEPPYDISELHSTRQALRDRINELEGTLS